MASRHAAKRKIQEYQTLTGLCEKKAAPQGVLRNVKGVTAEQWGFTPNPRRELSSLHSPHRFAACREAENSRVSDFDGTLQSAEGGNGKAVTTFERRQFSLHFAWLRGMPRSGSGKSKNLRFLAGLGAEPQRTPRPLPFHSHIFRGVSKISPNQKLCLKNGHGFFSARFKR